MASIKCKNCGKEILPDNIFIVCGADPVDCAYNCLHDQPVPISYRVICDCEYILVDNLEDAVEISGYVYKPIVHAVSPDGMIDAEIVWEEV